MSGTILIILVMFFNKIIDMERGGWETKQKQKTNKQINKDNQ